MSRTRTARYRSIIGNPDYCRRTASFSPKRGMRTAIITILTSIITIGRERPPFASAHSLSLSLSGISKAKPPKVLHWRGTLTPHRILPAIDYTLEQQAGSILNKSRWGITLQLWCPIWSTVLPIFLPSLITLLPALKALAPMKSHIRPR